MGKVGQVEFPAVLKVLYCLHVLALLAPAPGQGMISLSSSEAELICAVFNLSFPAVEECPAFYFHFCHYPHT